MYLDSNFGSMLIQLLIASIAGAGAYISMIKLKLKRNSQAENRDRKTKGRNGH